MGRTGETGCDTVTWLDSKPNLPKDYHTSFPIPLQPVSPELSFPTLIKRVTLTLFQRAEVEDKLRFQQEITSFSKNHQDHQQKCAAMPAYLCNVSNM